MQEGAGGGGGARGGGGGGRCKGVNSTVVDPLLPSGQVVKKATIIPGTTET